MVNVHLTNAEHRFLKDLIDNSGYEVSEELTESVQVKLKDAWYENYNGLA
jgi:hypothetical protein